MTTLRYWDPTTSQWLANIGPQGAQGSTGPQGAQGPQGTQGPPGGLPGGAGANVLFYQASGEPGGPGWIGAYLGGDLALTAWPGAPTSGYANYQVRGFYGGALSSAMTSLTNAYMVPTWINTGPEGQWMWTPQVQVVTVSSTTSWLTTTGDGPNGNTGHITVNESDSGWVTPQLQNGWLMGSIPGGVQYRKIGNYVKFRGQVYNGTSGAVAFTTAYPPAGMHAIFICMSTSSNTGPGSSWALVCCDIYGNVYVTMQPGYGSGNGVGFDNVGYFFQ